MKLLLGALMSALPLQCIPVDASKDTNSCPKYEHLLQEHAPKRGWDINRMSRFAYRESRCQPGVRSKTSDTGLLQINDINHKYLRKALGEHVDRWTLTDPVQNVKAAAALCEYWSKATKNCYQPWEINNK